jgi:alkanesulfonate monooxygenase SsuD/methylene tetrahydromethanopterin reductase-like flavin-dependent oxidoreductase (luciferase family)
MGDVGDPELALAAGATSAKVRAAARLATAITCLDMVTPDLSEITPDLKQACEL